MIWTLTNLQNDFIQSKNRKIILIVIIKKSSVLITTSLRKMWVFLSMHFKALYSNQAGTWKKEYTDDCDS